jgi:hypothetical protein
VGAGIAATTGSGSTTGRAGAAGCDIASPAITSMNEAMNPTTVRLMTPPYHAFIVPVALPVTRRPTGLPNGARVR